MVVALADHEHVAGQVLSQHIPGVVTGALQAADTQTLALADGVIHEADVAADHGAIGGLDLAGLGWQVLLEKVAEAALANEADAGGIFLAGCGQLIALGDAADFRLFQLADGK